MKSYLNFLNKASRVLVDIVDFKLICSDMINAENSSIDFKKILELINALNETIRDYNENELIEDEIITIALSDEKIKQIFEVKK